MGTDIYHVFQKRNTETNQWTDIRSEFEIERNYPLFSWVCGWWSHRMYTSRAGHVFKPLTNHRGMPEDYDLESLQGEYPTSWFLASEYLEAIEKNPIFVRVCWVSKNVFETWDGISKPMEYYNAISPNLTKVEFLMDCKEEFKDLTKEILRMVGYNDPKDIRMVFKLD